VNTLEFRDPERARRLLDALAHLTRDCEQEPVSVMHVCGSHEQAVARFGLRASLPPGLDLVMGPGCPVCVTDCPEIDARSGLRIATYGDMLRVPGSGPSLADASAEGAKVDVVYSVSQAAALARGCEEEIVFFASGFETTAVATAAVLLDDPPANLSVLSAHKYIPPAMEIVVEMPGSRVQGFLAAGHAATITGWGVFESFVERQRRPVVVAGFEPLDILAALVELVRLVRAGEPRVVNAFPRCVTKHGNRVALAQLWRVFELVGGRWRGIARVPNGNLRLRSEFAAHDARLRHAAVLGARAPLPAAPLLRECRCGEIMAGLASPNDCRLFGRECVPQEPVGACMVSSEGTCRIWHQYGGRPQLAESA
jgi:hydrogenase expression/formation protein HypD